MFMCANEDNFYFAAVAIDRQQQKRDWIERLRFIQFFLLAFSYSTGDRLLLFWETKCPLA